MIFLVLIGSRRVARTLGFRALERFAFEAVVAAAAGAAVVPLGETTGIVTMLLVKTLCAMYNCVFGFVGN
jgi:hypothetical protein